MACLDPLIGIFNTFDDGLTHPLSSLAPYFIDCAQSVQPAVPVTPNIPDLPDPASWGDETIGSDVVRTSSTLSVGTWIYSVTDESFSGYYQRHFWSISSSGVVAKSIVQTRHYFTVFECGTPSFYSTDIIDRSAFGGSVTLTWRLHSTSGYPTASVYYLDSGSVVDSPYVGSLECAPQLRHVPYDPLPQEKPCYMRGVNVAGIFYPTSLVETDSSACANFWVRRVPLSSKLDGYDQLCPIHSGPALQYIGDTDLPQWFIP